jgi:hypothetical protein
MRRRWAVCRRIKDHGQVDLVAENDPHTATINAYMARRWPKDKRLTAYVLELWADYSKLDVEDRDHVVSQLTNTNDEQFRQRLWELQLGSHLRRLGFETRSPKKGPDFGFDADGLTVWVECIAPAPRGIPDEWFSPPSAGVGTSYATPNDQMLLRWTSAFWDKSRRFKSYATDGTTSPNDACVIAINGGQLSGFWPTPVGISQKPWAVEVVFGVGPLQVEFFPGRDEPRWGHAERHEVRNVNGKTVSLYPFLIPDYTGISALITCVEGCSPDLSLPLYIAHNPLAAVPIPVGLFGGAAEEWQAEPVAGGLGEFSLSRVR